MRVFNHELIVRRNETFTIDKIIQNRDGSPYLISSEMQNPHFVITVSSTLYPTDDGYAYHAWLPYEGPRFYSTVPVDITMFTKEDGSILYPHGFEGGATEMTGAPSGYVDGVLVTYQPGEALFYYDHPDGTREYKYPYYDTTDPDHPEFKGWRSYECRIVHKFLQQYTRDWIEQVYYYNIDLVDGSLAKNHVDNGRPFDEISEVIPILEPTKLTVLSNLKGGMKWQ